jgi:hypothetical protein
VHDAVADLEDVLPHRPGQQTELEPYLHAAPTLMSAAAPRRLNANHRRRVTTPPPGSQPTTGDARTRSQRRQREAVTLRRHD